ncbi:MAG: alpha/beta hydrolase [Rhizobiaceae bacterium]
MENQPVQGFGHLKRILGFLKFILIFALTFYAVTVAVVFFLQEQLIFPAPDFPVASTEDENFRQESIRTLDGEVLFALHHPSENGEATILVFHGNADAAIFQKSKGAALIEAGFGVLLVEYRGYPGSTGTPTEAGLYIDGRAAYDFILKQREQPIGLYAHSLGTGVAVRLAAEREVFSVVLESPFDSLMAVAQRRFPWMPVSLLLKHKFQSDLQMQYVQAPVLIMHGDKDDIIPFEHGRRLHQEASVDARFLKIENAGHNDLSNFGTSDRAASFLKQSLQ